MSPAGIGSFLLMLGFISVVLGFIAGKLDRIANSLEELSTDIRNRRIVAEFATELKGKQR